ncbi:UNVERIFIED_ORG: SOS-response transcriptional repressor LexA [Rhizobium esperanzae]
MARKNAGFAGPKAIVDRFGWNPNVYKAHESGRNGFGIADAKKYAKAFKVNLNWLQFGIGDALDPEERPVSVADVPKISWVSAGQLTEQAPITDFSEFATVAALDLPDGDWIALEVEGNSMNKISPPGSIIFVNRRDKRLAPNALYVVADETGAATYKRYRPNDNPPFQPASYEEVPPPEFQGAVTIVGRVRRSVIEM